MKPDRHSPERPRQRRAERSEQIRSALIEAAADVVGEVGYADASIARITARAGVAQGTFYNHFESRQQLFDDLLPQIGQRMIAFVVARVDPALRGADRDVARLRAYFAFLEENPEFYRILYEAETLAPVAHARHMQRILAGYVRALQRSLEAGELHPDIGARDLEPIAMMLLSARGYLSMHYGAGRETGGKVPDWVIDSYARLVSNGLFRSTDAASAPGASNGPPPPSAPETDAPEPPDAR